MSLLLSLTPESILTAPFPLKELLRESLYYPSSYLDGSVIKDFASTIQCFVYCDYGIRQETLLQYLDTFKGYQILEHRPLQQIELVPQGWEPNISGKLLQHYTKYHHHTQQPFAHWAVYERLPTYASTHGPDRFSLLYVGGEAVATYQALYWSNQIAPRALAIIRPGTGFGFNWTSFYDGNQALGYVVEHNPAGLPGLIVTDSHPLVNWSHYPADGSTGPGNYTFYERLPSS